MRIDNQLICKGSIIFTDDKELPVYLKGRPMLVVSDYIPIFGMVWVVEITSKERPGIKIHLRNHSTGKPLGGYDTSYIKPYRMFAIPTYTITATVGVLNKMVMKEVDKSISFFLGFTEEIPEYLSDIKDYYGVEFSNKDSIHSAFSSDEIMGTQYQACYSASIKIPKNNSSLFNDDYSEDDNVEMTTNTDVPNNINPNIKELNYKKTVMRPKKEYNVDTNSILYKFKNGVSISTEEKEKYIIGWNDQHMPFTKISDISKEDAILIVSRFVSDEDIREKYGISKESSKKLRYELTNSIIKLAIKDLKQMVDEKSVDLLNCDELTILGLYIIYQFDKEFFTREVPEALNSIASISNMLEANFLHKDNRTWRRIREWYKKSIDSRALFDFA